MNRDVTTLAAYQGEGWLARDPAHLEMTAPCEWGPLARAALFPPDPTWRVPRAGWNAVQYAGPVNFGALRAELSELAVLLGAAGVEVDLLDDATTDHPAYNRVFMRDGLLATPWGLVLGRFASRVRGVEEDALRRYVAQAGLRVLATVPIGTFEAADALWMSRTDLLLGIGNRTCTDAARFVEGMMGALGVRVHRVMLPRTVQHLLGLIQLVGSDLVLVRSQIAPEAVTRLLSEHGFRIVALPENEEIRARQAMNVVVLGDRSIVMPEGCPETEEMFVANGMSVRTTPCVQLAAAAGGLACATGVIRRLPVAAS